MHILKVVRHDKEENLNLTRSETKIINIATGKVYGLNRAIIIRLSMIEFLFPRCAFFKISLLSRIWHICKAAQANPQSKLCKRAKSPTVYPIITITLYLVI
jgi:hypothetical protein